MTTKAISTYTPNNLLISSFAFGVLVVWGAWMVVWRCLKFLMQQALRVEVGTKADTVQSSSSAVSGPTDVSKAGVSAGVQNDIPAMMPVVLWNRRLTDQYDFAVRRDVEVIVRQRKALVVLWVYPGLKQIRRKLFAMTPNTAKLLGSNSLSLKPLPCLANTRLEDAIEMTRQEVEGMLQVKRSVRQATPKAVGPADSDGLPRLQEMSDKEPPPFLDEVPPSWDGSYDEPTAVGQSYEAEDVPAARPLLIEPSENVSHVAFKGRLLDFGTWWNNEGKPKPYKSFGVIIHDSELMAQQRHWGRDLERAIEAAEANKGDIVEISVVGETPSKIKGGRPKKIWGCKVLKRAQG